MESKRFVVLLKIAMGFGVMAFTVSSASALLSGVVLETAIYRASLAAGVFAVLGGLLSLMLSLFFTD